MVFRFQRYCDLLQQLIIRYHRTISSAFTLAETTSGHVGFSIHMLPLVSSQPILNQGYVHEQICRAQPLFSQYISNSIDSFQYSGNIVDFQAVIVTGFRHNDLFGMCGITFLRQKEKNIILKKIGKFSRNSFKQ